MAKAFKCDICGKFKEGTPLTHKVYSGSSFSDSWIECVEVCCDCNTQRKELYRKIGIENRYLNSYTKKEDVLD